MHEMHARGKAQAGRGPSTMWGAQAQVGQKNRYDAVAILLHWSIAVLILFAVAVAWQFDALPPKGPAKRALMQLHASCGFTVLVLTALRIGWRATHRPPPLASMPAWRTQTARLSHLSLYVLMLMQPVTGYLTSLTSGNSPSWFGLFELPQLVAEDATLYAIAKPLHLGAQWVLYALLLLHVGAALYHRFILRDDTVQRMLPRLGKQPEPPDRVKHIEETDA